MRYLIFLIMFVVSLSSVFSDRDNPEILVIHSYHSSHKWTQRIDASLSSVILEKYPFAKIHREYLDTKLFSYVSVSDAFYNYLIQKYAQTDFDLFLTSDDNALRFLLEHSADFFPEVPVIFCGVNLLGSHNLMQRPHITGAVENFDISANLELISSLPLDISTVVVVVDNTSTGKTNLKRFELESKEFSARFSYIILQGLPEADLLQNLTEIPDNSAVLNLSYLRDPDGTVFEPETINPLIVKASKAPVFALWDNYVADGCVGGLVASSEKQGIYLGTTALEVLSGTPAEMLSVQVDSSVIPYMNYAESRKFGISPSDFPPGTVLINVPDTMYYQNRPLFWFIIGSFAVLLFLIGLLLFNVSLRKQSAVLFKSLFNHIPDIAVVHSMEGRILFENSKAERYRNVLFPAFKKAHRDIFSEINSDFYRIDSGTESLREELSCRIYEPEKGGEDVRYFEVNTGGFLYKGKNAYISILRDISAYKEAESQLVSSLNEREMLLNELHHRVRNNLQTISGLLKLQSFILTDENAVEALKTSEHRVTAMAGAHDKLYAGGSLSTLDLKDYIISLTEFITRSYPNKVDIKIECPACTMHIDYAIPLGLILNELITNSMKYAFKDLEASVIRIQLTAGSDGSITFKYRDNGPGFDFDQYSGASLGLKLIRLLCGQLYAELSYSRKEALYTISIPETAGKSRLNNFS